MILTDFHIHSTYSDGKLTIPEIIDFYGQRGFGAIAITDHLCEYDSFLGRTAHYLAKTLTRETFPRYLQQIREEGERAKDQYGMIVFPGFELTKNSLSFHRSAHILGIGITDFISANEDVVPLARKIRSQGALAIAAHPVSTQMLEHQTYHLWGRRKELAQELDAWEVASGPILFNEVLKSGLPMIANSDLHHPRQIKSWKTALECERHPEAILSAIKNQEVQFSFYHGEIGYRQSISNLCGSV